MVTNSQCRIKDVFILCIFDASSKIDTFVGDAREGEDGKQLLLLHGPGSLIVVGRYAYLQLFAIDPRVIC